MMCNIAMYNTTTKELVAFARVRRHAQSVACASNFWASHSKFYPATESHEFEEIAGNPLYKFNGMAWRRA